MAAVYGNWLTKCLNEEATYYAWDSSTLGVALITDGYTLSKEETTMATAGAQRESTDTDWTPTNEAATNTTGTISCDLTELNHTWSAVPATQTVDAIVVYAAVTNDSDHVPIAYGDFTPIVCNGSDILITLDTAPDAIFTISY